MKTALALKMDSEGTDMEPAQEIKLLTEVAELRSDVRHLQSDVTEIKSKVDKIETKFEEKFKGVDASLNQIKDMIASAKLWAYGLYVGGGFALLYVIARSQKWF